MYMCTYHTHTHTTHMLAYEDIGTTGACAGMRRGACVLLLLCVSVCVCVCARASYVCKSSTAHPHRQPSRLRFTSTRHTQAVLKQVVAGEGHRNHGHDTDVFNNVVDADA